jgi:hypothetical protein
MHLGHGSTNRERPRKAFESTKELSSKGIEFGDSSISGGGIYRRKWSGKQNWFWKILSFGIVLFIAIILILAITKLFLS